MQHIPSLREAREKRDEMILVALEAGETQADLAHRIDMTQQGVSDAAKRAAARLGRAVPRQPRRWAVAPRGEVTA